MRRLVLGLIVGALAAPTAQGRIDDSVLAQPDRTVVRHPDGRALPPGPGVNPRALLEDDRVVPAVVVRRRDGFDWGEAEMALAGMAFAGVLFGAGLLFTVREARRMV